MLAARGYRLGNADLTIIAEQPRIAPRATEMRTRIAEALASEIDRISVKATTNERIGFIGRGEGIAALAVVTIVGTA
jgi:2-C-methyl-D-erythritol 2,4-cyclodiphosphate synthase